MEFNENPARKTNESLAEILARHGQELPADQVAQLENYCRLLWNWNTKLNLTRHTDFEKFFARDLVDSRALAELLEPGESVLDVGTGGGVPGVVLAILRPDLRLTLIDAVGKKARVVQQIVAELGLPAKVHQVRVQEHLADHAYDTLVGRAVARLHVLLSWLAPHVGAFDRALILKGPAWVEERQKAREAGLTKVFELRRVARYPLAWTKAESVILEIRPRDAHG